MTLQLNHPFKKRIARGCLLALLGLCTALSLAAPASATQNTQVASGYLHYLAVKPDGTLWTWGHNFNGQLGNGQSGNSAGRDKPVKVLDNVVAADAGSDHTLALRSDGSVWAWGANFFYQLGDGTRTDSTTPKKVMDGVRAISAGSNVSAAIKTDNSLWVWGNSFDGALVDGGDRYDTPHKVMEGVASVTVEHGRTYIIKTDGSLWACGANDRGELGNGKVAGQRNYPDAVTKPFKVMDGVKDVAPGSSHTLVLKKDGTVWAFGSNTAGQIGNGSEADPFGDPAKTSQLKPVKVMEGVKAIAAGGSHSLAITKDNGLWAWGSNRQSQREGTGAYVLTPKRILDDVSAVASCGAYTAAVKTDGSLWFWRSGAVTGAGDSNSYTGVPEQLWKATK